MFPIVSMDSVAAAPAYPREERGADASPISDRDPPDALYRERGYGQGGLVFGVRPRSDPSQTGACADLAFAEPKRCRAAGGYGFYGNALGQKFGQQERSKRIA